MELSQPSLSCLGVKRVYVLCDQPVELPSLLPLSQGSVCRVRSAGREPRPPHEVSRPVALSSRRAADELGVLHGSSVGARVQPDALRAVVGDPRLRGQSRSGQDEQAPGFEHEVPQQLQRASVGRAAAGDEAERTCRG